MSKIRLIQDGEDDDFLIAIVLMDEMEIHPGGEVYPVLWVGYGDDVQQYCSMVWIGDQKIIEEFDYAGETDFKSLYENVMLKRRL